MRIVNISFQRLIFILLIGMFEILSNNSAGFAQIIAENGGSKKQTSDVVKKKWFPGHYLMATENDFNCTSGGWTALKGAKGYLFKGIWLYVTWGEIETGLNTYRWDKIDKMLNELPAGKKLAMALAWQEWQAAIPPCPADMIDDKVTGLYRGGYVGTDTRYSTFYLTSTMNRYLAFMRTFAERYDTCQKIAFIMTGELAGTAYRTGPGYNATTTLENMYRLPQVISYFPHTPCGMLTNWWPYGGSKTTFLNSVRDAGGGFGAPDIYGEIATGYETDFTSLLKTNAGKMAQWFGMEWSDLVPPKGVAPFPNVQMSVADLTKTNFIWWNTNNRSGDGGWNFSTDVINYLIANPSGGITTACPDNIICEGTVSNLPIEAGSGVNIYPNPVDDVLRITTGMKNTTISITNLSGTEMYCQTITESNIEINVNGFPSGMYILKIGNNQNKVVRKFTKS